MIICDTNRVIRGNSVLKKMWQNVKKENVFPKFLIKAYLKIGMLQQKHRTMSLLEISNVLSLGHVYPS